MNYLKQKTRKVSLNQGQLGLIEFRMFAVLDSVFEADHSWTIAANSILKKIDGLAKKHHRVAFGRVELALIVRESTDPHELDTELDATVALRSLGYVLADGPDSTVSDISQISA